MSLLVTYIEALKAGDARKLASVFSEDGVFDDHAPTAMGLEPMILEGRKAIEETFSALLAGGGLNVQNVAYNDNAIRYDMVLSEQLVVRALGVYQAENGKITHYHVVPTE
jgi:hypothetical protein